MDKSKAENFNCKSRSQQSVTKPAGYEWSNGAKKFRSLSSVASQNVLTVSKWCNERLLETGNSLSLPCEWIDLWPNGFLSVAINYVNFRLFVDASSTITGPDCSFFHVRSALSISPDESMIRLIFVVIVQLKNENNFTQSTQATRWSNETCSAAWTHEF